MKKLMIGLGFIACLEASALDFEKHIGLGLNVDTVQSDLPNEFELDHEIYLSPTLGMKGMVFWGNVGLRSGLFLEWKRLKGKFDNPGTVNDVKVDLDAYYLAIPLNLQFNLNERWAIFGGVTPRLLLTKRCEDCGNLDDDPSYIVNYANGGITYEMSDTWSVDIAFHHPISDNFEDLKISTAQAIFYYRF